MVALVGKQMLQLLAYCCFARALGSAHPEEQWSVRMRLSMFLKALLQPEVYGKVVLIYTCPAETTTISKDRLHGLKVVLQNSTFADHLRHLH